MEITNKFKYIMNYDNYTLCLFFVIKCKYTTQKALQSRYICHQFKYKRTLVVPTYVYDILADQIYRH